MMKKHTLNTIFRNATLMALVFVLSTQPIVVAARTLQKDPQSLALELALQGGDRYLDSASKAVVESSELLGYLNTIHNTPIDQINESYIADVIDRALSIAEESSIALGAVDDLADGIEQLGGTLPAAIDIPAEAGIPDEMRTDLIAQGIPAAQVDEISAGASSLYSSRQGGMDQAVATELFGFGFTQSQIDQIALAVNQRGLVNSNLNTRMDQFRATQDELADTRSGMLVLAVQMLGYQIAIRQANNIPAIVTTDEDLQELAEDEVRLLVHAAHLNAMWGNDPDSEIGEGDWWFIEHYAGRAAERLQTLTVESQNRGQIAELFVIHQMKMLAVSARTGDAEYAKAELDRLASLMATHLNSVSYYQERLSPGFAEKAWSQLTATSALREKVEWTIPDAVAKNAALISREHMESMGVKNLAIIYGDFEEPNEVNNTKGILIVAGLSFFNQTLSSAIQAALEIFAATTPDNVYLWLEAILTGDTDNPVLLTANIIVSLIPVLGVLPDVATLVTDPSMWIKALSILGIIGSLGDLAALTGIGIPLAAASFTGDAVATLGKTLFRKAAAGFRAVLNGLKLTEAFDLALDLTKTVIRIAGDALQNSSTPHAVFELVSDIFTGTRSLWDDFIAFVTRAKAGLLLKLGFDEGSALVGRVLREGVTLSDEALTVVDNLGDKMVQAGVKLSDDGAEGVAVLAKNVDSDDVAKFSDKLLAICGGVGNIPTNFKLARPAHASSDCVNRVTQIIGELDSSAQQGVKKLCNYSGGSEVADLVARHVDDSDTLKGLFGLIGESRHNYWTPKQLDGLEKLVFDSSGLSTDAIKYLPINSLDEDLYPGFTNFLKDSNYLDDNIYAINSQAQYGNRAQVLGHISQLQGEFRELRFQQYAVDNGQNFLFRHTGPINEGGVDALTKKGNNYYWVDVKDRGQGAGIILDGSNNSNNALAPSNLTNYFTKQGGSFVFNKEYFESEILYLAQNGEINMTQYNDLLNALDEGRVSVMVFAGGTNDPFNSTLKSLSELVNPDSNISIPFIKIPD